MLLATAGEKVRPERDTELLDAAQVFPSLQRTRSL